MATVTIDGITVEVETGATILDAARKADVWIPTLCHNPSISPPANCRICMVELDRGDWKQMVTACNYPVRRDITVSVASPPAVRARNGVMQLLLARAPGNPQLTAMAMRMGVTGTKYPTVTTAERDCILCGLCTAVCEEVLGYSAIGFAGRGVDRVVCSPFYEPSASCIACGACAVVCPVGTIQVIIHEDQGEVEISPFKSRSKLLTCEQCGQRSVSVPVAEEANKKIDIDWDEFRRRAKLCPKCRRRAAATAINRPVKQSR